VIALQRNDIGGVERCGQHIRRYACLAGVDAGVVGSPGERTSWWTDVVVSTSAVPIPMGGTTARRSPGRRRRTSGEAWRRRQDDARTHRRLDGDVTANWRPSTRPGTSTAADVDVVEHVVDGDREDGSRTWAG